MLTRAEQVVAVLAGAVATAVLAADVPFRAGWRVAPLAVLVVALLAGAAIAWRLRRAAAPGASDLVGLTVVAASVLAAATGLAWPELLPVGGGPDLAHHLVLINHIERAWRLVDDPALYPYLGDMMDYTPGSHLLIALAGRWTGTGGLHAVQTVLASTVALKAGLVYVIARRLLPPAGKTPFAAAAVLLLFLPYQYTAGSFAIHSYWAQVVAELFAVGAWWSILLWDDERWWGSMALFALFSAAAFATWPIWIGPIVLAVAVVVLAREQTSFPAKMRHLAIGVAPIALIAVFHAVGRLQRLQMAVTSGFALRPTAAVFGWTFLAAAAAGLLWMAISRRGRAPLTFLAAILTQSLALWWLARVAGADTPYMALKMMYLTPYPLAVAGACAAAAGWRRAFGRRFERFAWAVPAVVAAAVAGGAATGTRPAPVVTESVWEAGRWADAHVDRACVDYLVAEGYTGYWLHLAVLDNPRGTARFDDPDTFDPQKAIARWVETDGLPYAIVGDVNDFSKALFGGTETLARFGDAMVIRRLGASTCGGAAP